MENKNKIFTKKKLPHYIRLASGISLLAMASAPALSQDQTEEEDRASVDEVVVTGQRLSILSAQDIKRDADQIVDSIVASDIGKLPDRSVTEALQRIPGVTITRFKSLGDPEHFSAEGSGVMVRGLTMVRSELNGRDSFTADGGRALSFQDVPPELMAGVDVYKNQSADLIEGGLGGTVNLRTKKPFDYNDMQLSATLEGNYGDFVKETTPSASTLFSNRWNTDAGEMGLLLDFAYSEAATRTDGVYTRAFFPRDDLEAGRTVYVPRGADWRSYEFERERQGAYGVFQWRPSDSLEMHFQVFNSRYKEFWDESSIFVDNWPMDIVPAAGTNFTYDDNGIFRSGRLASSSSNGGIPMGAATRFQDRKSETTDFSYNLSWNASERWDFNFDLQHIKAKTNSLDSTVATGVELDYLDVDLTRGRPTMQTNSELLSDPSNYYMAFTMDNRVNNKADETALRLDAHYQLEDPVWRSAKFGLRFTDTNSENRNTGYDWQPIYQQWMRWWALDGMAPMPAADPNQLRINTLSNFYRGNGTHPGVFLTPSYDLAKNFPNSFLDLHQEAADSGNFLCPDRCGQGLVAIRDINDPAYTNVQDENTSAIYGMTYFGWDELKYPVSGNVGARVVKTEMSTKGSIVYPNTSTDMDGGRGFLQDPTPISESNSYTNVLPSLNLRMLLSDDLQLRFAAARAMSRPAFGDMQAYMQLSANLPNGVELADGPALEDFLLTADLHDNPKLKPTIADQYDLSLEWYFSENGGMVHMNIFYKDISDLVSREFVQEEYGGWTYDVARPTNNGEGKLQGVEIGVKKFFDQLPEPFSGLGVDTTYTYIDSKMRLEDISQPVDTDFSSYGSLPFTGISRNAYNFTAMYEWGPISARLAYNWRSKFLMGVGQNGFNGNVNGLWRLPVYNDDYGQVDASVEYRFSDKLALSLQAINLLNAETVLVAEQNAAGSHKSSYVNDTTYIVRLNASF